MLQYVNELDAVAAFGDSKSGFVDAPTTTSFIRYPCRHFSLSMLSQRTSHLRRGRLYSMQPTERKTYTGLVVRERESGRINKRRLLSLDISLVTQRHKRPMHERRLHIDTDGSLEVNGISINLANTLGAFTRYKTGIDQCRLLFSRMSCPCKRLPHRMRRQSESSSLNDSSLFHSSLRACMEHTPTNTLTNPSHGRRPV